MSLVDLRKLSESLSKPRTLDRVRLLSLHENDFHRNGIESDLDDIDKYLALERQMRFAMIPPISRARHSSTSSCVSAGSEEDTIGYLMRRKVKNQVCVFCKNNGETLSVYGNHTLKDANNRTVCPILRRYVCPKCGATGDNAHTIKYCPVEIDDPWNSILLLRTPRLSTGRRRQNSGPDSELCGERSLN